jgi:rhamnosyltransferase
MDSSSTDGSLTYLEKQGVQTFLYDSPHFNYAHAFNLAAKHAKGDILVRLSGDVIPLNEHFLEELIRPFSDEKVGATYGRYTISGRKGFTYPDYWQASRFPEKEVRYHAKPPLLAGVNIFGKIFNLAGGCCAIRKSLWKHRPFNENMLGGEDAEYAWFLHMEGYDIVYNPKATVLHEHIVGRHKPKSLLDYLNIWQFLFNWQIIKNTAISFLPKKKE